MDHPASKRGLPGVFVTQSDLGAFDRGGTKASAGGISQHLGLMIKQDRSCIDV